MVQAESDKSFWLGEMFWDSNSQIKLRAKQKFKFLSATEHSKDIIKL